MRQGKTTFTDPRVTQHGHLAVDVLVDGDASGETIYRQNPDTDGDDQWYAPTNAAGLGDAAGGTWETLEEAMTEIGDALAPHAEKNAAAGDRAKSYPGPAPPHA